MVTPKSPNYIGDEDANYFKSLTPGSPEHTLMTNAMYMSVKGILGRNKTSVYDPDRAKRRFDSLREFKKQLKGGNKVNAAMELVYDGFEVDFDEKRTKSFRLYTKP